MNDRPRGFQLSDSDLPHACLRSHLILEYSSADLKRHQSFEIMMMFRDLLSRCISLLQQNVKY